jgi:cobyrinic acid a,c-diamide synthase
MLKMPRLVISATRGGLGKTTFSLGIIRAWRKRGRRIAVFKKGPDFIDAGWLGAAAGQPCYNLDPFMMEPDTILWSFAAHSAQADAAIIEGNRGLYDGVDESGTYSTARLSKLLAAPVVVIVDCTKASGTVGAVVLGLRHFDPETAIRGVILNNVSAGRHESVIRKAIEQHADIPVLGAVPRQRKSEFPERHMGLTPFHEHPEVEQAIEAAALLSEKHLDLNKLWEIACVSPDIPGAQGTSPETGREEAPDGPVIGVIRDTAFQFYYPDNLEALRQHGARLVQINALKDQSLPEIDALYIGGGFPETQAAALAANQSFCLSLRAAAEEGLPIYAECGGLIYLGRSLQVESKTYPMTGVLPLDFVLEKKPQAHGYTLLRAGENAVFLDKDVIIKGHEFHYSRVVNTSGLSPFAYDVNRGGGIDGKRDGLVHKNVVAAYTHIHALGTPQWAPALVRKARAYRTHHESTSGKQVLR